MKRGETHRGPVDSGLRVRRMKQAEVGHLMVAARGSELERELAGCRLSWEAEGRWDSEKRLGAQYRLSASGEGRVLQRAVLEGEIVSRVLDADALADALNAEYQVSEVVGDGVAKRGYRTPERHPSPTMWMGR